MASNSDRKSVGKSPTFLGEDIIEYQEASNRGSWIISYADMMTIILTFFILLLSISTIAQTKYELMVQAFTGKQEGTLQEVQQKVDTVIQKKNLGGQIETNLTSKGLTIEFSNALLFDSGEAELTERAREVIAPIERHLVEDLDEQYGLIIEGYTDDVPINNERYRSNWELSTSRAIHVMERLRDAGLDKRRLSVQGFADTRAATDVDIADTEAMELLGEEERQEVRAANRRVIIRIDRLDNEVLMRLGDVGPGQGKGEEPARQGSGASKTGESGKSGAGGDESRTLAPFELPDNSSDSAEENR